MSWDRGEVCDRCGTRRAKGWRRPWFGIVKYGTPPDLDACSPSCLVELATRLLPADGGDTPAVETTGAGVPIPGGQRCNGAD